MTFTTIIGLMAAVLTTVAFVPQALKTIRTKHTQDLSLVMYSIMTLGILLWLIYGIAMRDLPIILANAVSIVLSGTILVMKLRYK
jgi:MtN3 and saliva related transmembrane protein